MPRPRTIDRDAIVRAGLEIADRGGVGAVTMHAVAEALAVTPMALYRHVDGKDALLDGIVEVLLHEIADRPGTEVDPGDLLTTLRHFFVKAQEVANRHPEAFLLLLSRPAATEASQVVRGRLHHTLRAAGVAEGRTAAVERILTTVVLGMTAGHATKRFAAHDLEDDMAVTLRFLEGGLGFLAA